MSDSVTLMFPFSYLSADFDVHYGVEFDLADG